MHNVVQVKNKKIFEIISIEEILPSDENFDSYEFQKSVSEKLDNKSPDLFFAVLIEREKICGLLCGELRDNNIFWLEVAWGDARTDLYKKQDLIEELEFWCKEREVYDIRGETLRNAIGLYRMYGFKEHSVIVRKVL